ncbi:MAG: hypothetical protein LIO81_00465 [Clostridiales bacterium]|nr:hypothetical protein [Clostridiales bacterium]
MDKTAGTIDTTTTQGSSEEETKAEEEIFLEKLSELIAQYGVLDAEQTGTMHTGTDEWFDPDGLLSATILDFDADGAQELLVCVPEECSHSDYNPRHIRMDMWEVEVGKAVLSDSMFNSAYVEAAIYPDNRIETPFLAPYGSEEVIMIYALPDNGGYKLVCGSRYGTSFFADGSWRGYWMLEYTDGKFRYINSFTCPGPGSAGFEFTGYDFTDGTCASSELYYSEQDEGADQAHYESYEDAFAGFFKEHGLELAGNVSDYGTGWNACDSMLQATLDAWPDGIMIVSFVNKMTYSHYDIETYAQTAKFTATLSRGNDLLDYTGS